jgi:probable HAF family extracellular repeat protein
LWIDPLIGGSALDINNHGIVVGRYGSGSGIPLPGPGVPFGRGFVWDSTNGRRDLGLEPVGNTQAVAINNLGQVVGTSEVLTTVELEGNQVQLFIPRAFLWDETNGIQDIGTLGGMFSFGNTSAV